MNDAETALSQRERASSQPQPGAPAPQTVAGVLAVLLVDHLPQHRAWAWLRLARGSAGLRGTPGLLFSKIMGSGEDGGFSLRPSGTHHGLVCLFEDQAQAQAFLDGPVAAAHRQRARRWWNGLLAVASSRGSWDGVSWGVTPEAALEAAPAGVVSPPGPIAVLTRASIRPHKAVSFWRRAPRTEQALAESPGCQLAMGLGEAPLLRQCTFSVWRDVQAMSDYAHSGAHGRAAQSAWREGHFSESMFVRMRLLASSGAWPAPGASHGH